MKIVEEHKIIEDPQNMSITSNPYAKDRKDSDNQDGIR
jgi:hypothetical protein